MDEKEFLNKIGINKEGNYSSDNDAYVIDLDNSEEYGRIFSKLDKSDEIDLLEDNQVITEQGSSLIYEAEDEGYILNLIADFDEDKYQLIVNKIGD